LTRSYTFSFLLDPSRLTGWMPARWCTSCERVFSSSLGYAFLLLIARTHFQAFLDPLLFPPCCLLLVRPRFRWRVLPAPPAQGPVRFNLNLFPFFPSFAVPFCEFFSSTFPRGFSCDFVYALIPLGLTARPAAPLPRPRFCSVWASLAVFVCSGRSLPNGRNDSPVSLGRLPHVFFRALA